MKIVLILETRHDQGLSSASFNFEQSALVTELSCHHSLYILVNAVMETGAGGDKRDITPFGQSDVFLMGGFHGYEVSVHDNIFSPEGSQSDSMTVKLEAPQHFYLGMSP